MYSTPIKARPRLSRRERLVASLNQAVGESTLKPRSEELFGYLTRPENAARLARMHKAYFDALAREGFTEKQALSIITSPQFLQLAGS